MTQKERNELKRPQPFTHRALRDFHPDMVCYWESEASLYMDKLEAENQRMRELLAETIGPLQVCKRFGLKHDVESFLAEHP